MKKTIITLGCLTLFASGWAFGRARSMSYNGTFWKSLGSDTCAGAVKTTFVFGFFTGFERGFLDGGVRTMERVHAPTKSTSPATERSRAALLEKDAPLVSTFTAKNISFSYHDIASEMDSFYSDYRNAPVCWSDALMFSLGSLEGHPPTEQELSEARLAGANNRSCDLTVPSP